MASGSSRTDPSLLLVGTDFRCSPLEVREKVAYSPEETEKALVHLLAREEIEEAFLLSTCNRTEAYLQPKDEEAAYQTVLSMIFTDKLPEMSRPGRLYVKRDREAARHLLSVASGLESMVLGEPEILGQVKQAAALADTVGASGTVLRRLIHSATTSGKRARAETAISAGAVSLGYSVVELAKNIFTEVEETRVLIVGAGETARMVTRNLWEKGFSKISVANRTRARAEDFCQEFPFARLLAFEERAAAAGDSHVVVVTTGAEEPVLTFDQLSPIVRRRRGGPLLVVDLGVPRNVEPKVGRLGNVFLHSIDSLENLIQRNLRRRREEVPRVEELVGQELERFRTWYRGLEAEPLIARLQKQAEAIRQQELAVAQGKFPAEMHDDLDRLTRSLVRKILHYPSTALRGKSGDGSHLPRLELVRELFQLDDEDTRKLP